VIPQLTSRNAVRVSRSLAPEAPRQSKLPVLFFLLFLPVLSHAQAPSGEGWAQKGSSLLLYDADGSLANEIGLTTVELPPSTVLEIAGGTSPAKTDVDRSRFAWVLERRTDWNASRTKKTEVSRQFRFLGTGGKELWTSAEVDRPESGEPIAFSRDGERVIVAMRPAAAVKASSAAARGLWSVAVRSYVGNTLLEAGPFPRLRSISLTPNGQFALVRWYDTDKSATHTFLEVATKARQDFDSERFLVKAARLTDEGKVFSGEQALFDFAASTSAAKP
jgi:hypothetical protein